MKERLGMTEIRKQANRLNFGEVRNIKNITFLTCLSMQINKQSFHNSVKPCRE